MKKVFLLVCAVLIVTLTSCGYSKEDMSRARSEGYNEGFEAGYDLAKYEAKGDLERAMSEYSDDAYNIGYDEGYDAGWFDCLESEGIISYHGSGRIEKDKG